MFSGQFRTPPQAKWHPKTFYDVIISSDVIHDTPTPVAILVETVVTTALIKQKLKI